MIIERHVSKFLEEVAISKNSKLIVAVSGGLDSMVLWHALHQLKIDTIGVHVNYHLRNEESNKDENLVKLFAEKNGLKIHVFQADPSQLNSNLQEKARIFRYTKFREVLKSEKAHKIALAHHLDDSVETFFINMIRGSGINGLKGISSSSEDIIRPLLKVTKKDIEEYAKENKIVWREDASNASKKYLRNRIRNKVLPSIYEIDERAKEGVIKSLSFIERDRDLLNFFTNQYFHNNSVKEDYGIVLYMNREICNKPNLLYHLLKPFGEFDPEKILSSLKHKKSGNQFASNTHEIWVDRERLIITQIEKEDQDFSVLIQKETDYIKYPIQAEFIKLDGLPNLFKPTPNEAWLDMDKLDFPLKLRRWKDGDKFTPFGMKGSKKLSDYFTDLKLSIPEKKNIWILESAGKIVWVVGFRIDDEFKVGTQSKKIYLAKHFLK